MKSNKTLKILIVVFALAVVGGLALPAYYYTQDSYLVLKGDENVTVGLNGFYFDPGVTAFENGKDVSDQVISTGAIDYGVPGDYTIEYKIGNFTLQRNITVLDYMDPKIVLTDADKEYTMTLGDKYKEPGFTATDSKGNDITSEVTVTEVNLNRAGEQKVTYTVTDSEDKTTKVSRIVKVKPNKDYSTSGLPICMYQYVYDDNDPPEGKNSNCISASKLEEELKWLNDQDYYFPTWQEVIDYINGELLLPEKSVVITFDDSSKTFLKTAIPILEKYQVPATCFIVTSKDGAEKISKYHSQYLEFQSNSDNMHRGGGDIGHGGIFTKLSKDEALADLKKSIEITGTNDVFAYPFGDYNDACKEIVKEAGFKCAVTTRQGRVMPGDDPYSLPRQRMGNDQTMDTFRALVLPY